MFFLSFFFFKQKTAYEMRISDWSSDVCSSDLVEQYAAAAVDLRVDEAGQQPAAPQVDLALGGRIAGIRDRSENAVDHGQIRRLDGAARQRDPAVVETKDHKVPVTLVRWGGEPGSWPRASASGPLGRAS